MTQADLASRAGVSQQLVSLVERGHLDAVAIRTVRRLFGALDARFEAQVSWRGGQLDRLLDAGHAALVGVVVRQLEANGWSAQVEVSYSVYGERGSIDVLAIRAADQAAVVVEVKNELASFEALARKTDEKVRLVRGSLCRDRFEFDPVAVGRVLVLPESDRSRQTVFRHRAVLDVVFPERTRAVRSWLRAPIGSLAGIVFIPWPRSGDRWSDRRGQQRVRSSGFRGAGPVAAAPSVPT